MKRSVAKSAINRRKTGEAEASPCFVYRYVATCRETVVCPLLLLKGGWKDLKPAARAAMDSFARLTGDG
jgi:hypothetical protein